MNARELGAAVAGRSPASSFMLDPSGFTQHLVRWVALLASGHGWRMATVAVTVSVIVTAARSLLARGRHHRMAQGARLVTILPPPTVELADAAVFWTQVLGLLRPAWARLVAGQPHLAWEYLFTGAGLTIRLWVPVTIPPGLAERAVESAWPGAHARPAPSPGPADAAAWSGGQLRLARPDWYPLRTEFTADPLRALLGAASALAPGEQVIVQVLARPVTGRRLRRAHRAAAGLRGTGLPPGRAAVFGLLPGARRSGTRTGRGWPGGMMPPEAAADMRAILGKAAQPRLACAVRYAISTTGRGQDARARRRGRGHAVAAAFAVYSGPNHLTRRRLHAAGRVIAARRLGRGELLSAAELGMLAHLPADVTVPGLTRAPARPVAPPPQVPAGGEGCKILGDADTGQRRPVAQAVTDARYHTHVLGQTGTGKTTWLLSMALADADAGRGFVFIESKGDSARLLSRLPQTAAGKVVLLDPDDAGPHPCVNVLDGPSPALTADTVCGIFARLWPEYWGPRSDDVLRSSLLTLTARPGATLADVPRLLTDTVFRQQLVSGVTSPELRGFWGWYDGLSSDAARGTAIAPLMNKLRAVLLRGFARDVLAAGPSTVNLAAHLDDGGIVIARLAKGALGEDTTRLLSSLLLAKTWEAVLSRARRPEYERPDITIYVDECHNALAAARGLDDMLAEARGYRAAMVLAHQNLAQLPRDLREALSANARSKIFFDISPEDAHALARHVHPQLTEHDLAHLDAYQAAARLVADGALTPAFTMRTRPLSPAVPGRAALIRASARAAFGTRAAGSPAADTSPPSAADPRISRQAS